MPNPILYYIIFPWLIFRFARGFRVKERLFVSNINCMGLTSHVLLRI